MSLFSDYWEAWSNAMTSLTVGAYLQAMSLPLSMTVAWLTFKATSTNQRYSLIIGDVTQQIRDFSVCCSEITKEIEVHYLGDYEGGFTVAAAKESRKRIMAQIKALDHRRSVLNVFLCKRLSKELERKFDEWQKSSMGDNFPITRKDERCKEYDAPVVALHKAQSDFDCYLADLRRLCIDHRKLFRRVFR